MAYYSHMAMQTLCMDWMTSEWVDRRLRFITQRNLLQAWTMRSIQDTIDVYTNEATYQTVCNVFPYSEYNSYPGMANLTEYSG